jgi:hypothetical protein
MNIYAKDENFSTLILFTNLDFNKNESFLVVFATWFEKNEECEMGFFSSSCVSEIEAVGFANWGAGGRVISSLCLCFLVTISSLLC